MAWAATAPSAERSERSALPLAVELPVSPGDDGRAGAALRLEFRRRGAGAVDLDGGKLVRPDEIIDVAGLQRLPLGTIHPNRRTAVRASVARDDVPIRAV